MSPRCDHTLRGVLCLLLLAAGACSTEGSAVAPPSFDRPGAVSFVCFDQESGGFVPLDDCPDSEPDTAARESRHLIALVAQTSRGQIATVDVAARTVLDGDRRVPGFTFERTDEVPIAIITPADDPRFTYVASYGARTLSAIPTDRLHPEAMDSGLEGQRLELAGAPTDLVPSQDGRFLYVTIPDEGLLLEVPLTDGVMGEPRSIALRVDALHVNAMDEAAANAKVCADGVRLEGTASAPSDPSTIEGDVAPVAAYVDEASGRIFVADARLPIIHVLTSASGGAVVERAPLDVGAPTLEIVITPPVPEALLDDGMSSPVQYGYAIDARTGGVLVFDATMGAPTEGAVLPVSDVPGAADRLALPSGARTLTVLTPGDQGAACDGDAAAPDVLRGVFVAVGMNDGLLRIIDVHDADAVCRGGLASASSATGCVDPPRSDDAIVFIRRHRPRIGGLTPRGIGTQGAVTLSLNGTAQRVNNSGQTDRTNFPGLLALSSGCPQGMGQVFPPIGEGDALICTQQDPWWNRAQRWLASWEGLIPGTEQGLGRISADGTVQAEAGLCELGVMSAGAGSALGFDYAGDMLVITSSPDDDEPACQVFAEDAQGERPRIAFGIERATDTSLSLGAPLGAYSLAQALDCFGDAVAFEIRSRDAFTVSGSRDGMLSAVVADDDGACVVDVSDSSGLRGRAAPGVPFDNGMITFTLGAFSTDSPPEVGEFSGLSVSIGDLPVQMSLDVGVLPSAVEYLPSDERLYAVDAGRQGLTQVDLTPIKLIRSFQ